MVLGSGFYGASCSCWIGVLGFALGVMVLAVCCFVLGTILVFWVLRCKVLVQWAFGAGFYGASHSCVCVCVGWLFWCLHWVLRYWWFVALVFCASDYGALLVECFGCWVLLLRCKGCSFGILCVGVLVLWCWQLDGFVMVVVFLCDTSLTATLQQPLISPHELSLL